MRQVGTDTFTIRPFRNGLCRKAPMQQIKIIAIGQLIGIFMNMAPLMQLASIRFLGLRTSGRL